MIDILPPARLDRRAALRFGVALILLWFGYMKFLPYEAEGVRGIAEDYWLFGWLYPLVGVGGASAGCGWVKTTCGATRRTGRLANSSRAERSSAVAPKPNTSIERQSTTAATRKRKPGSMNRGSAFAGIMREGPRAIGDAVTYWDRPARSGEGHLSVTNQRAPEYRKPPKPFVKNSPSEQMGAVRLYRTVSATKFGTSGGQSRKYDGNERRFAGFVLNAP